MEAKRSRIDDDRMGEESSSEDEVFFKGVTQLWNQFLDGYGY